MRKLNMLPNTNELFPFSLTPGLAGTEAGTLHYNDGVTFNNFTPLNQSNSSLNLLGDKPSIPGLDYLKMGLNGLSTLGGLYMGMKNYGLMKKAFNQSVEQWNKNYEAQKRNYNSQIEDRQRARLAANPTGYESLSSYMNKNRIN